MKEKIQEDTMRSLVKPAFDEAHSAIAPEFDEVWANAESEYGRARWHHKLIAGLAVAVAVVAVVASLWPAGEPGMGDDYLIADALMNSTLWLAPSDSLLPEHQFDIYQGPPFLIESTISLEGTLL